MFNRQIALSAMSILTALSLTTGATLAYFSDSGTSSGNTFSTGTVDLKLTDTNEPDANSVTASFGANLAPGSCTGPQTLTLKNTGTMAANHAEVAITNMNVNDVNNDATPDMDAFLRIQTLTYDGVSVLGSITNSNGNGFPDLDDWEALGTADGLDSLSLSNINVGHDLVMNVCLDSSAGNPIQGDGVNPEFTVTLNQDVSQ